MKRLLYILILIAAVFMMFQSCGRGRGEHPLLSRADSLMFVCPDSSLALLEGMAVPEDEEGRAYYALLLTQARCLSGEALEGCDSLLRCCLDYYETSTDSLLKSKVFLCAAIYYRAVDEKQQSLYYIRRSASAAEELDDNSLHCIIEYYWARILQFEKPYDEAISHFRQSYDYALASSDTVRMIGRLREIGWCYLLKERHDSAEIYVYRALDLSYKILNYELVSRILLDLSVLEENKGSNENALIQLNQAQLYAAHTSDSLKIYCMKGAVLMRLGQLDSAAYYINKGRETATLYDRAYDADLRSQLAERRGDYRGALSWSRRYSSLLDSISRYENDHRVMTLEKRYNYARVEAERNALEAERQHSRVVQLLVAMACMVAAGAGIAYVRRLRRTLRERLRAKEELAASAMAQLHRRTGDLLAMEEAMSAQSSELERHRAATEQQRGELSALREERESLLRRLYAMNATVRKVEALRNGKPGEGRRVRLDATELNDLLEAVNTGYDGFIDRLRMASPSLSDADLHLCALLRMGLSHLHISELLGCSESALRKRKSRLKTDKLGDTTSRSLEEILEYL